MKKERVGASAMAFNWHASLDCRRLPTHLQLPNRSTPESQAEAKRATSDSLITLEQ